MTIVQDIEIRPSLSQYTPECTACQAMISLSCIIYRLRFQDFLRILNISFESGQWIHNLEGKYDEMQQICVEHKQGEGIVGRMNVFFGTDTQEGVGEYIYFIERKHYENV
ncbi:hypothetical protein [Paenibacillus sp. PCH8]|uniref:hypothetical protein n=1 Tax=Paenibacillus sp. PCH8 TaxID=2066524 RepID=UPI0015E417D7|nr:hypothetical protein [Paenibacillus sp. PCH8]